MSRRCRTRGALCLSPSSFSVLAVDIRRGQFSFKPLICNYSGTRKKRGGRGKEGGGGEGEEGEGGGGGEGEGGGGGGGEGGGGGGGEGGGGEGGRRGEEESVRARLASFHIFTTRIKYQATSLCFHEKKDRGERRDRVVMREIRASKFHRTGGDNARISSLTDSMGEDIETISFPRV